MQTVGELRDDDLFRVTGGWDWSRTGRAAGDGAAAVWNVAQNLSGSPTGSTTRTKVYGALGSALVLPPVFWGVVNTGYDAVRQGLGYPEDRYDRQRLWNLAHK